MQLSPLEMKIFAEVTKNPALKSQEIAERIGSTSASVKMAISRMYKKGAITSNKRPNHNGGPLQFHEALIKECETVGIPVDDVRLYWYKGKSFSIMAGNKEVSLWDIKEEIIKEMSAYSPKYPKIDYRPVKDKHLLVVDPADIHIGKLCRAFETGDEYNHRIAIDRVKSGVTGLLQKASAFTVDKVVLIIGNDILHTDNNRNMTTGGTPQDQSIMWYDAFNTALKLYVEVMEMIIQVGPVHIMYNPSNHDYVTGFMLAQTLQAWFRNCKNVTFDISPAHRKYFRYFKNAIGSTHGDGAKENDLALLMAHEFKHWHDCPHRYFFTHHIHHKKSKDYMSVTVEALRSPSGTDSYHHKNGYQHAPKAVESFIHHYNHGQIARLTHIF